MEKYPVIIGGKHVGELRVTRVGAKTEFEADCEMLEGIVRLAVFGAGSRGYLGVLAPKDGRLHLKKTLSPSAMRGFPEHVESAGSADAPDPEAEPETAAVPDAQTPEAPAQEDEQEGEDEPGELWRASPDGALYCFAGAHSLVALPADDRRLLGRRCLGRRLIGGREYAVLSPETYRVLR